MKQYPALLTALAFTAALSTNALALPVPSDGSDGALNLTSDTVIDLSQAVTGNWTNNNTANAGKGIYDTNQWAVVFKYSSVVIQGVTDTNGIVTGRNVTFLNHPSHAPVVWLVQGNVTINGIVNLNGQNGTSAIPQDYTPAEPGPGGFRGGATSPLGYGAGYGPGGTAAAPNADGTYGGIYGNPQILPLIGGSGSGALQFGGSTLSGAAGGGAILIVASGTVTINGILVAKGQTFNAGSGLYVRGASGAVKIIADQILGSGTIDASGPTANTTGRTRMETTNLSATLNIFPNASAVAPGTTPTIWPATNAPTVRVVSVNTTTATNNTSLNPYAATAGTADIAIQTTNTATIYLETKNLPIQGVVSVRITPKYGQATVANATYVSGNILLATWSLTTTLPQGYCVLQARATAP